MARDPMVELRGAVRREAQRAVVTADVASVPASAAAKERRVGSCDAVTGVWAAYGLVGVTILGTPFRVSGA